MTQATQIPGGHPGEISANALLLALASGQPPTYATAVHTAAPLPSALTTVKQEIAAKTSMSVGDILLGVIRPQIVFRQSFTFQTANTSADRQKVFRTMSSGTSEYAFDLPGLGLTKWFADLFGGIVTGHPATMLHEFDLFHGHVVPNEATRDVVIVFHAKEYPSDVIGSFQKNRYAANGLISTGSKSFASGSSLMNQRNFVWTLKTNTVYLLDGGNRMKDLDSDFGRLMSPEGDTRQLRSQERTMGTVQERQFGQELFTVNYFPTLLGGDHTTQVFFNPVGSWGVLVHLEKAYPGVPSEEIAKIFTATGESLKSTEDKLKAWTPTT